MRFLEKYTLTKRFYVLFALTIAVALSTSLIFYYATFDSMKNEKTRNLENISMNLMQNTEDIAASVILMSETISTMPYTHAILTETNPAKRVSRQQFLNRLISRLTKNTSHINNILLVDNGENVYSFNSFDYMLADRLDRQYHILSRNAYADGFTGALSLPDTDTTYYAYIQTICNDSSAADKKELGTCVIICYGLPLDTLCANAAASGQSLFAILDADGQVLACNRRTDGSPEVPDGIDSEDHLILEYQPLPLTGWKLFCSVPYEELYAELLPIRSLAALLIVIPCLAFLLLALQISTSIVSPLARIVGFFQKGSYYILHNRLETKGSREIQTLTANINQMLADINELTHTVLQNQAHLYEIQLSKNQAQLLALQTQINPHFLYNTLSSIQGMAYQQKYADICTAVTSLSYMMRYNINEDSFTSIESEFLCIEKYLKIMDLRFSGCFRFRLHIDEGIREYRMPRFLLQPLVENAITHGLEPRRPRKGSLALTASLQGDSILHFECADDGVGIPPERLEELRRQFAEGSDFSNPQSEERHGIGLANIHMRIRLIYGVPFGLSLSSGPEGTVVCADFPADIPARMPIDLAAVTGLFHEEK